MPESFEGLEGVIKKTYERLVEEGTLVPQPDTAPPSVPLDLEAAKKAGKVLQFAIYDLTCDVAGLSIAYNSVIRIYHPCAGSHRGVFCLPAHLACCCQDKLPRE